MQNTWREQPYLLPLSIGLGLRIHAPTTKHSTVFLIIAITESLLHDYHNTLPLAHRATLLISSGVPPVSAKLVKRIQDGLFVEMAELLPEALSLPRYSAGDEPVGQKQKPLEVNNIMDWMQCLSIFIAIISCKEPNRIADLIRYQNLIIYSSFHCQVTCK